MLLLAFLYSDISDLHLVFYMTHMDQTFKFNEKFEMRYRKGGRGEWRGREKDVLIHKMIK